MTPLTKEQANDLLRATVEEVRARSWQPAAAGVKSRMRQISDSAFDERLLGYSTFRAFLEDAERNGLVSLHRGKQDLLVTPPGTEPPPQPAVRARTAGGTRIRRDLWDAFVDWSPGQLRFYDRASERARVIPQTAGPREDASQRQLRERVLADPRNHIPISPIAFETQLAWMHEFASAQPPQILAELQLALTSDRPARDFTARVKAVPLLASAWHTHLVKLVAEVIEAWAAENQLAVDPMDRPPAPPPKPAQRAAAEPGRSQDTTRLRTMLHRAIDQMPAHELATLKIPIGYLVSDEA